MFHKQILSLALLIFISAFSYAQNLKIGYANLELVLAYMPETQQMNNALKSFEAKLQENLNIKEKYLQTKFQEYQDIMQANPNDPLKANLESELTKLQNELQNGTSKAQRDLAGKRESLLQPIIEKVDNGLAAIQKEQGYDYILNTVDGNGVSIILKGPEEHDLTKTLMTKLGIQVTE